ncbi:hypothetical protein OAN307_c16670 [Octadecabacter antarcticus 307]|uniref:Uncharacterized protein n=1 Tax=Octadecabacter antarcticus 307 TaxID=391626 RepID=M9RBZ6_9RHOB|nr:hypothetical protein [Octadecabacter antarcticus]AGI67335.1 hypothetical protein OAN307_c16670 [Octadecabacter antarcticus 307]
MDRIPAEQQVNVASCIPSIIFDDTTINLGADQERDDDPDAAYWTVLRQFTHLGMIQN